MLYVMQTFEVPNKLYIVKADNQVLAAGKAGLINVPKRTWCLEHCIARTIVEDVNIVELD